jgi:hypothetical protein
VSSEHPRDFRSWISAAVARSLSAHSLRCRASWSACVSQGWLSPVV